MSEWIRCPNCGTVMTVTTSGYLCPMCGTALPVKILHMTSGTSPEVDAVPVIRCRECLYKPHCESYIIAQQEDAYCSWAVRAERKEE